MRSWPRIEMGTPPPIPWWFRVAFVAGLVVAPAVVGVGLWALISVVNTYTGGGACDVD